jgi:polyferredoxin
MIHRLAAELVLALHALFVLVAVFGGFLFLLDAAWLWLHLPVLAWTVAINFGGWTCPLTPMESRFRERAGQTGYQGGFIQHYLEAAGLRGMDRRTLERRVAWALLAWNSLLYLLMWLLSG